MSTLAVMQPYFFPYIGYFQLIDAVDEFVFFDDAQYIKRGYCNRNDIMVNGKSYRFSVPVQKAPRDTLIKDIVIHQDSYSTWRSKFLKTVKMSYHKAPNFEKGYHLIEAVLDDETQNMAALAQKSVVAVAQYLGIYTKFQQSSNLSYTREASAEEKIIGIAKEKGATTYINMINGAHLYTPSNFDKEHMVLKFLQPKIIPYAQEASIFQSHLSIIDVLMYEDSQRIKTELIDYNLLKDTGDGI